MYVYQYDMYINVIYIIHSNWSATLHLARIRQSRPDSGLDF